METKQIVLGTLTAVFVFGAYFIGLFHGQNKPGKWREFFHNIKGSLTWRGFAWAAALPTLWVLLYYTFIAHVWFSLGRWPRFGERLDGQWLTIHDAALRSVFGALVGSLYVAPIVLLVCLFIPKRRHISVYTLCYGGAVGLASCALFLAPHPFLNWLFD
jgi:hypothetical protein